MPHAGILRETANPDSPDARLARRSRLRVRRAPRRRPPVVVGAARCRRDSDARARERPADAEDGRGRLRQERLGRPRRAGRPEGNDAGRRPRCASSRKARRRPSGGGAFEPHCPTPRALRSLRAGRETLVRELLALDVRGRLCRDEAHAALADRRDTGSARRAGRSSPSRPRAAIVTTVRLGVRPGTWRAEIGENGLPVRRPRRPAPLEALGYLDRADVSGSTNYLTEQALLAFQGWEGLDRTGTVTGQTQVALFTRVATETRCPPAGQARRDLPRPRRRAHGRGR